MVGRSSGQHDFFGLPGPGTSSRLRNSDGRSGALEYVSGADAEYRSHVEDHAPPGTSGLLPGGLPGLKPYRTAVPIPSVLNSPV